MSIYNQDNVLTGLLNLDGNLMYLQTYGYNFIRFRQWKRNAGDGQPVTGDSTVRLVALTLMLTKIFWYNSASGSSGKQKRQFCVNRLPVERNAPSGQHDDYNDQASG